MKALLGVQWEASKKQQMPLVLPPGSLLFCGAVTDRFQGYVPLMGRHEIQCTRPQCSFSAINQNANA